MLLLRIYTGQKYPDIRTLRISKVGIRVQKHSGNIHFNKIIQIHCYHRTWYNIIWILNHQEIEKYDLQWITGVNSTMKALEQQKGYRESIKKSLEGKRYGWSDADLSHLCALWWVGLQLRIPLWSKLREFRHAGPGLSEKQPNET